MSTIFRRYNIVFTLSVWGLYSTVAFAQSQEVLWERGLFDDKEAYKEAYKNFQKGESLYEQGIYSKALTRYLTAYNFNPNNSKLNMRIGECYLYSSSKLEARAYLQKAFELNERINISIHLLLGKAQHLEMEWAQAIKHYGKFINLAQRDDVERINLARKRIEECKYGQVMAEQPINVKIEALPDPVNSKFAEYHPLISADEAVMYFTSRRENTTGGNRDLNYDVYYEDVYKTSQKDGIWDEPEGIGPEVNTAFHDATVGLSPDGQQLFIFKDDVGDGNIYYCELDGDKWSAPVKLNEHINSEFNEATACFSFDGMTIYFVSDRPGGFGQNDIYIAKKGEDGDWGVPKNLGASINTVYNEDAVFMHPDGKTLYFSSEGHANMGGHDIFQSVYDSEADTWSTPGNMGYPINSTDDDVFFVLSASGERGYYSSIKNDGLGEKDIYMITFPDEDAKPELTLVKGVVIDKATGRPIYADIEVIDNEKNEVVARSKSNKLTGEYLFSLPSGKDYGVTVTADRYFFHSENINVPESSPYYELLRDIGLSKIREGKSIVLNFLYFEYDKSTLSEQSIIELDRVLDLMNTNTNLIIEIAGHTDNMGTQDYNMQLSKRRAQAVVNWLASKNIDMEKMTANGYGFSKPIETNDTEEGRAKNRRTEFVVLEYEEPALAKGAKNPPRQPEIESRSEVVVAIKDAVEARPIPETIVPQDENPPADNEIVVVIKDADNRIPIPETVVQQDEESLADIDIESPATEIVTAPKELSQADSQTLTDGDDLVQSGSNGELSPTPEPEVSEPDPNDEVIDPMMDLVVLRQFSSYKPNYYSNNSIEVDPIMPEGVVYRIQIGSFSKLPEGDRLKALYPITAMKLDNGLFRCSVGEFRTYKEAKLTQKKVRATGFSDAFLIAFYNQEKIPVSKAINLE